MSQRLPVRLGVSVRCDGCGHADVVTSRSQLGILEELHVAACDVPRLTMTASTDDLLALRPYDDDDLTDDPQLPLQELQARRLVGQVTSAG